MGRGFGLDMYIVKVANKEVVKLEEVAKVALVILVSLVNLVKYGKFKQNVYYIPIGSSTGLHQNVIVVNDHFAGAECLGKKCSIFAVLWILGFCSRRAGSSWCLISGLKYFP